MARSFAVTYDYRCPFARNAHEAVIAGLRGGKDWDVRFLPFSLDQVHVPEGETAQWDRPAGERGSGMIALEWGLAVRDSFPEQFFDFHVATFAARFDDAIRIDDEANLRAIAQKVGLDPDAVAKEVAAGHPLDVLKAEHTECLEKWNVFGVPTFIDGDEAVFIRFMERGRSDDVERALDLLSWTRLSEFKRTRVPR